MKKIFLLSVALIGFTVSMNAQHIADNALGLRLGDSDGFGTEISYQLGMYDINRLEFGLGWRSQDNFSAVKALAIYQWVWQLDGNFHWYAGVGGGVLFLNLDNIPQGMDDSETSVFAAGNIGLEYDFDIPLLISLDFRPEFGFGDINSDTDFDIALGLRYQF